MEDYHFDGLMYDGESVVVCVNNTSEYIAEIDDDNNMKKWKIS